MNKTINIYCDESSHLENDESKIMGLGAITCPSDKKDVVFKRIREYKVKHGLKKNYEIKWNKVSKSKLGFYLDLVDYFFDVDFLGFRSVIINKDSLDHDEKDSSHDEFYYKMYFLLLRQLLEPTKQYKIFLDKKDTNGKRKIAKLNNYLCNSRYDYKKGMISETQEVLSHQVELVQLCDLFLGAVCYTNRGLETSSSKKVVINKIKERSNYSLIKNTYPSEQKMNTLIWISGKKNGGENE